MRSCDEILEWISAALDNQLNADEQAALNEHLAHCPACSALYDDLRTLQAATVDMDDIPAPTGFTDTVMSAIAANPVQVRGNNIISISAKKKPRTPWKRWGACAAAVAVVVLGASTLPGLLNGNMTKGNYDMAVAESKAMDIADAAAPESFVESETTVSDQIENVISEDSYGVTANNYSATNSVQETAKHDSPLLDETTVSSEQAQELLADMTLHEKLCQLFVVHPQALTNTSPVLSADKTMEQALTDWPVGGFLLDKSNMSDQQQLTDLTSGLQSMSEIPLILTCDEEGGRVNRLMSTMGTTRVDAMLDYKDDGSDTAFDNASIIAADMVSYGFNLDLAPVADVWSNPDNTVIGDRAYSNDFEQAAELVAAAVEGFHEGGVACTLKHFPGHGDTSADSHYGSVYVYKTLAELRENELLPFQAGIDAGTDAVMIGHLIISDISSEPALFSYEIVTELLRNEMGFDGVVITDALQMQAMTDHYSSGEIAVKAVQAGVDILLCPADLDAAVAALEEAVKTGIISETRINESVLRILNLKIKQGMLS